MKNKKFELVTSKRSAPIIVEPEAYEGVRIVAAKSAADICLVTGVQPQILSELPQESERVIVYATIGKSRLLRRLFDSGKLNPEAVEGHREVYGISIVEHPWEGIGQALVIYGSDKRGSIYGIFTLSEQIGVSPLIFWGDVRPECREELILTAQIERISKEPSVKYRGFFINDEWPCFGNWAVMHYGGFTAKMYDKVFELLLRLKGNYLWPAMWTSSFALDGPGEENARLADIYGVIIGNSHHEPCLRAGEEWDIYRGEQSEYGNEWNYVTNKEGLLKYWADGLKRSGRYESIVTVGMRGERDSHMLGPQTLADNIAVLKDIMENQNRLIEAYEGAAENKMPRLLAIYKEVEQYFYGDEQTPGLKDWEGLDSVILMLCEDNFGNMRTLPDEKMRNHKGGYGMYYHLDYHGSPVSYEWMNSTPLVKIWEQMTACYEYGVREVWMVNVGDLKGNEFPLSYFLSLAYDFETWGTGVADSPQRYTAEWIKQQFGSRITQEQSEELQAMLTTGIWLNSLRKPEALDSHVYHPAHYLEADRMLRECQQLLSGLEKLGTVIPQDCREQFYSMIAYPLQASVNLLQMQLYAGKNEHYAKQGKKIANRYADKVTQAIHRDKELAAEFAAMFDRKWQGMELGIHIGFRKWNEDGCRYPLRMQVEPFDRPRMVISRMDGTDICVKNYGRPEQIEIRDFLYPGTERIGIEVANDGIGSIQCEVKSADCPWLRMNWEKMEIDEQEILWVSVISEKLPEKEEVHVIRLSDGDTEAALVIYGKKVPTADLPPMTFYEKDGITAIRANHYAELRPAKSGYFGLLEDYGKLGYGLKAFPATQHFLPGEGPAAVFRAAVEQGGSYLLMVWSAPSNPLKPGGRLSFGISINKAAITVHPSVSENFQAGEPENQEWSDGVLNQVHENLLEISCVEGVNEIVIYAVEPGFVLEGLFLYKKGVTMLPSYLGPPENWHT